MQRRGLDAGGGQAVSEVRDRHVGGWDRAPGGASAHLYRAADKPGVIIDLRLSPTRNTAASAKRFPAKAPNGLKECEKPAAINTDEAPTHGPALAEIHAEGADTDAAASVQHVVKRSKFT
ncbi:IS6 family transposase [Azospirillum brasilense]|uniref:IS6 family transposase n=2 Tax=Azospirillum brasilense TaxID=192 RepID=A0A6L3AZX9_AZOBR|nr:IS6 family transposase [Azospirillum brasilense]